jgi:hypothetical protein
MIGNKIKKKLSLGFILSLSQFIVPLGSSAGPIHDAARQGDINQMMEILREDYSQIGQKDECGQTPLHLAVAQGHSKVVRELILAGADLSVRNNHDLTPLDIARAKTYLNGKYWKEGNLSKLYSHNWCYKLCRDTQKGDNPIGFTRSSDAENQEPISPISEEKQVILTIELMEASDPARNSESNYKSFEDNMRRIYPGRQIRRILAMNFDELEHELKHILKSDEMISHLVISGHGHSQNFSKENAESQIAFGGRNSDVSLKFTFDSVSDPSDIDPETLHRLLDRVNRLDSPQTIKALSGIRGRFTRGAQVYITSCYILIGSEDDARKKVYAISNALGLTEATLYANKTAGQRYKSYLEFLEHIERKSLIQLCGYAVASGMASHVASRLNCPVISGISSALGTFFATLPTACYCKILYNYNYVHNHGYLCNISGIAGSEVTLTPIRSDDFEKKHFIKPETDGLN